MVLALHPAAKAAAIAALNVGLAHVKVAKGALLDSFSAFVAAYQANETLPQTGKFHDELVEYIDDLPLAEFVVEQLRRDISESDQISFDQDSPTQSLCDLPGFEDIPLVASRLIDAFVTLPWRYSLTLELSNRVFPEKLFESGTLSIGQTGRLTWPDLLFGEQYPLDHDNPKIKSRLSRSGFGLLLGPPSWKQDRPCYQHDDIGYIGIYGRGNVVDRAERRLESFLGLGIAMRLLTHEYQYQNSKSDFHWIVHICNDDQREFYTKLDLDEEISEVLRHINSFKFDSNYPEDSRVPWLLSVIHRMDSIIRSDRSNILLLSSKWFFDSFKGKDQTLHYIRLMTTLEILLGEHADTSKASLGEILGNRLAYLIGKNHKDRSDILSDFKKIYNTRSHILHHGKHKLKGQERTYIAKLRTFCQRAIEEEVRLILA